MSRKFNKLPSSVATGKSLSKRLSDFIIWIFLINFEWISDVISISDEWQFLSFRSIFETANIQLDHLFVILNKIVVTNEQSDNFCIGDAFEDSNGEIRIGKDLINKQYIAVAINKDSDNKLIILVLDSSLNLLYSKKYE